MSLSTALDELLRARLPGVLGGTSPPVSLAVERAALTVEALPRGAAEAEPRSELTVDLQARELRFDDRTVPFELDDFSRRRLLDGLDDIGLTLRHTDAVDAYEARRPAFLPAALPVG